MLYPRYLVAVRPERSGRQAAKSKDALPKGALRLRPLCGLRSGRTDFFAKGAFDFGRCAAYAQDERIFFVSACTNSSFQPHRLSQAVKPVRA
jgi:hypothetical protein